MKSKKFIFSIFAVLLMVLLASCGVDEHSHTYSEDWSKDANYHWHQATCEHLEEVSEKAEHSWDSGTITTQPTEENEGVKTFSCTVCGQTKSEPIEKLQHTHTYSDEWSKDETYHWHAQASLIQCEPLPSAQEHLSATPLKMATSISYSDSAQAPQMTALWAHLKH